MPFIKILENIHNSNIKSEGLVKGVIQVPGDGNPIVLASEHPTIGGYPKIATVLISDLFKLVQLEEGSELSFEEVDINVGEKLYFDFLEFTNSIQNKIVY